MILKGKSLVLFLISTVLDMYIEVNLCWRQQQPVGKENLTEQLKLVWDMQVQSTSGFNREV